MDENGAGILAGVFGILVVAGIMAVAAWVWYRILGKTGHSGWLGLLMLVPVANLILVLVLAFGEWPIHRELRELKERVPLP